MTMLDRELQRARRFGYSIAVVMADFDKLKEINDVHGHLVGDAALMRCRQPYPDAASPYDAVGRYGGDEFILVLSNCAESQAKDVCQRIHNAVVSTPVSTPRAAVNISLSMGNLDHRPAQSRHRSRHHWQSRRRPLRSQTHRPRLPDRAAIVRRRAVNPESRIQNAWLSAPFVVHTLVCVRCSAFRLLFFPYGLGGLPSFGVPATIFSDISPVLTAPLHSSAPSGLYPNVARTLYSPGSTRRIGVDGGTNKDHGLYSFPLDSGATIRNDGLPATNL